MTEVLAGHVEALRQAGAFDPYPEPQGTPSLHLHRWDKAGSEPGLVHYLGDVPYDTPTRDAGYGALRQADASLRRRALKSAIAAYLPPEVFAEAFAAFLADADNPRWKLAYDLAGKDLTRALRMGGRKPANPHMLDGLTGASARWRLQDSGIVRAVAAHPSLAAAMVLYETGHQAIFKSLAEAVDDAAALTPGQQEIARSVTARLRRDFTNANFYSTLLGAMLYSLQRARSADGIPAEAPLTPAEAEAAIREGTALFFGKNMLHTRFDGEDGAKRLIAADTGHPVEQICPALAHLKHSLGAAPEPRPTARLQHGDAFAALHHQVAATPERFTAAYATVAQSLTATRGGPSLGGR